MRSSQQGVLSRTQLADPGESPHIIRSLLDTFIGHSLLTIDSTNGNSIAIFLIFFFASGGLD